MQDAKILCCGGDARLTAYQQHATTPYGRHSIVIRAQAIRTAIASSAQITWSCGPSGRLSQIPAYKSAPAPDSLRGLAAGLFVTPNTLKTHLRAIYLKLGAESREEAVIRAREGGLI